MSRLGFCQWSSHLLHLARRAGSSASSAELVASSAPSQRWELQPVLQPVLQPSALLARAAPGSR